MLLESPAPASFSLWLSHFCAKQDTFAVPHGKLTHMANTQPPSIFAARLLLDLKWQDSRFTLKELDATSSRGDFALMESAGTSMLEIAAMVRDVEAMKWLIKEDVDTSPECSSLLLQIYYLW